MGVGVLFGAVNRPLMNRASFVVSALRVSTRAIII